MKRQAVKVRKKRGPAPTGKGTQIQVRLQQDDLSAVDSWIAEQEKAPTRPEAIRTLMRQALKSKPKG
ncbi:ribbon-helix-helix domain-containing protein [Bradyrhizobium sp. CB1015]|uniref:ribbon-helix-helix domain-containing protein n=1 Tax=Bradyrhizobium sp. CB1015 TaxID=2976822 RepID=UPI0021A9AEA1|nr:ribbon-helix-helix domain-containing protein [Bradyrhizobium sp. CB1015]UWU89601.1 ribbon-helix-helix domain-containing protein [Bradyrhizobium sp. CB1015]